jgi:hypothetical protein
LAGYRELVWKFVSNEPFQPPAVEVLPYAVA